MPNIDPLADAQRALILGTIPANIPDEAVMSRKQSAAILDISTDTLDRLRLDRVRVSERNVGYTMGTIRAYQRANTERV